MIWGYIGTLLIGFYIGLWVRYLAEKMEKK